MIPARWKIPGTEISAELSTLEGGICQVECIGYRWEGLSAPETLTLILYRTPDFRQAVPATFAARVYYLEQGFSLTPIPAGNLLPDHSWAALDGIRAVVLYTSQGPVVIGVFWETLTELDPASALASLSALAGYQSDILRQNGFLTINPLGTPLP